MRAWDYPKERVHITCESCGRMGRYSRERFVELVGRDTQLPDALRIIAKDCPKVAKDLRILHDQCGARFGNLG